MDNLPLHITPSISIIIPVHNTGSLLQKCLDSVFDQDFSETELEVILVDDSSTDSSLALAHEYANKHTNLRIVTQCPQGGVSKARNKGLDIARGTYILFVDSDDFLVRHSLRPVLDIALSNDLDMLCFCHVDNYIGDPETEVQKINQPQINVKKGVDFIAEQDFMATPWWFITKRTLVSNNHLRFPEGHMLEDAAFAPAALIAAQRMAQVENVCYCYVNRPGSIMHNSSSTHMKSLVPDYVYAAIALDKLIASHKSVQKNELALQRLISRRNSYIMFGMTRAFKVGMINEFVEMATAYDSPLNLPLYPCGPLSKNDYPGIKWNMVHWLINQPKLLNALNKLLVHGK